MSTFFILNTQVATDLLQEFLEKSCQPEFLEERSYLPSS